MPPKKKEPTFESQLAKLEEIVTKMETGGLSLEESLKCFEEGAALEKSLEAQLKQTKRRLTQLMSTPGEQTEIPMEDVL
ncbi:MAG: exodeoxyribonuclease VII small subunit [Clostridia bacterium]|nr:exodeoxyribonuclease VII small subunit [Clostridia bacterium]